MRTSVRRGLSALAIAGGFTLLGVATAESATADESVLSTPSTSGEDGTGSGNQTTVDVQAPVEVSGNQVTVVGDGNESAAGDGGSTDGSGPGRPASGSTSGEDGTGSGNQTAIDVCAPVDATGNQVTVIGDDNRSTGSGDEPSCDSDAAAGDDTTSGEDGILSGNQSLVDVEAPLDASGNQVTVIGDGNTRESSSGGAGDGSAGDGGGDSTSGEDGILSGNQSLVDVEAPLDASGNQVTVIGDGNTRESSSGGAGDGSAGDGGGDSTSGEDGTGSGNQTGLRPYAPVDASGNQVTVIGDGNSTGDGSGDGADPGDGTGDGTGGGDGDGPGDGDEAGAPGDGGGDGESTGGEGDGITDGPEAAGEQATSGGASGPADGASAGLQAGARALTASPPTEVAAGLAPGLVQAAPGAIPAYGATAVLLTALTLGWFLLRRRRSS